MMGVLTDAMTRLHDEVSALRDRRMMLVRGLEQGALELRETVGSLRESNRSEQAQSARKSRAARAKFVKGLAADVRHMQGSFAKSFAAAAQASRAARRGFLLHQKGLVDAFLQGVADDLAGARHCWQGGPAPAVSPHKKHPVHAKAETVHTKAEAVEAPAVHTRTQAVVAPHQSFKPAPKAPALAAKPAAPKQHAKQAVMVQAPPPAKKVVAARGKAKSAPAKTRKAGKR